MKEKLISKSIIFLLLFAVGGCSTCKNNAVPGKEPRGASYPSKPLDAGETLRVKRSLHPLPHELSMSGRSYAIPAGDCALQSSPGASPKEKQIIDAFKEKWQAEYNVPLKENDGRLTIIAGVVKNSPLLQKASENGVFDAKYLAERPSPEQAYAIATVADNGKLTVYVAANDNTGLYYGLLTFKQLLNGLSKNQDLTLPHCRIVDWPDIPERGVMAGTRKGGQLQLMSEMKLNVNHDWIWMGVSSNRVISYGKGYHDRFLTGEKYNIKTIPHLVHIDYLFSEGKGMDKFPELAAAGKTGERIYGSESGRTFCYGNPKAQDVMDQIFEAIAKADLGDRLVVQMGESPTCCYCDICKGDMRKHFINEIKHIMHAYQKAKAINPALKMDIVLTQGTWPHHYAILDFIPKDVGVILYSGSGAGETYKTTFGEYILTPQAEEIVSRGYKTGVFAVYGPALLWGDIIFPTYMSQFTKLRMSEIKDRGLYYGLGWMTSCFNQELNIEAFAEFSWNAGGRMDEEFIAAWAQRKNMAEPDKVARVIKTLEYPIWAMASGMRTRTMTRSVERIVSLLNGGQPYWGPYFEILNGFEYHNNEELVRVNKQCDEAVALSKELKNGELIASSLLVKQWVAIIERYAFFLESKDPEKKKAAKEDVIKLSSELPALWKNWIDTQQLDESTYKASQGGMNAVMKEFDKLKKPPADAGNKK